MWPESNKETILLIKNPLVSDKLCWFGQCFILASTVNFKHTKYSSCPQSCVFSENIVCKVEVSNCCFGACLLLKTPFAWVLRKSASYYSWAASHGWWAQPANREQSGFEGARIPPDTPLPTVLNRDRHGKPGSRSLTRRGYLRRRPYRMFDGMGHIPGHS